jgi:dTDP-4-dehydrorhamnose reductase
VTSVSIIGPNGQLGSDLVKVFTKAGWRVNPITHSEISVENGESVSVALKSAGTDWVINTAAFHKVDECEKDSQKAWEINAHGAKNVALVAKEHGIQEIREVPIGKWTLFLRLMPMDIQKQVVRQPPSQRALVI